MLTGVTATASAAPPPVSVSLSASTSQLPSSGGSVVVHVDFRGVEHCRLHAPSQVRGERRWGSCSGAKAERLWFPAQGSSLAPITYRVIAVGSSPAASASSAVSVTVGRSLAVLTSSSSNWSGVAAIGVHREVGATWVVPDVSGCSGTTLSYSDTWVGLGTNRIVQGGTFQACEPAAPGGASYTAWTEAFPAGSVAAYTVAPGDRMQAVATQSGGLATITVTDLTTGSSVSKPFAEGPPLSGAEWIEEDPAEPTSRSSPSGSGLFPLADFHHVVFSAMSLDDALPAATTSPLEQFLIGGTSVHLSAGAVADRLAVIDGGS